MAVAGFALEGGGHILELGSNWQYGAANAVRARELDAGEIDRRGLKVLRSQKGDGEDASTTTQDVSETNRSDFRIGHSRASDRGAACMGELGSGAATGCSGGTTTPGGPAALEAIFDGYVFDLIRNYVDDHVPPIDLEGLDFGGIVILQNLNITHYGNAHDNFFKDSFGLTADPAPNP